MATLNFPSDPGAQTPVNTYGPDSTPLSTSNNITYVWDGEKWVASTQNSSDARYVNVTGDTMTGDLTVPNLISQGTVTGTNIPTNGSIVGYQQGIWTPQIPSSNVSNALWRRFGNSVMVQAFIGNIGTGLGADDTIEIKGLPYPIDGQALGSAMAENFNILITACFAVTDNIKLYALQSGGSWQNAKGENRANNNANAWFSIEYRTDDTTWTPLNGATVS